MKSCSTFLLLITLLCAINSPASGEIQLATCNSTVVQDENPYYPSLVGKTAVVSVSYQIFDAKNRALVVRSTDNNYNFNLVGILPPTGFDHKVSFSETASSVELKNCSRGILHCDPTFAMSFDKTSKNGTFTNYIRHCEPNESCTSEIVVFAVSCDKTILIPQ